MLADMTDDDDSIWDAIRKNVRPVNAYWAWRDKPIGEQNAARDILSAAAFSVERLSSCEDANLPPDCEAIVDGLDAGIEVTELVNEKRLKRSLEGKIKPFNWHDRKFSEALQNIIDEKSGGGPRWQGGPYDRRLLIIHADEPDLSSDIISRFLDGRRFTTAFFSDVVLGLSYEPATQTCPSFRLSLDPL